MDEFIELLGLEITTVAAFADKSESCPFASPMPRDSDWQSLPSSTPVPVNADRYVEGYGNYCVIA